MRVTAIEVKGLFGIFDHRIPLTGADRVTIVHGPNGFGKTVILNMIASLINGDAAVFEHVPFVEFGLLFDDHSKVVVRHSPETKNREEKGLSKLAYSHIDAGGYTVTSGAIDVFAGISQELLNRVDTLIPGPYHRSGGGWRSPTGEFFTLAEIVRLFPRALDVLPKKFRERHRTLLSQQMPVFFVETKRIYAEDELQRHDATRPYEVYPYDEEGYVSAPGMARPSQALLRVDQYSRDIAQRIKSTLADYAKNSQESDRTFPERLVRFVRTGQTVLAARNILDQMIELETKRQRLVSLGFLDSESGLRDLTEDDVRRAPEALTIYVGDVHEKLKVFDDLVKRAGTLIDVLNERFTYKRITIRRDVGFRVMAQNGEEIALADLSSGEQHELVVLYELLFRAPPKGLILVDEPEISLHVAWQSRFLQDLIDILKLTDSYAIVATHSPVIIGNRWDLAVELRGPSQRTELA